VQVNVTPRTMQNRGFSVSSIHTEKMVFYGAWVLLHFLPALSLSKCQEKVEDNCPFLNGKKERKNHLKLQGDFFRF